MSHSEQHAGLCLFSALLYLTSFQSIGSEFAVVWKKLVPLYFPQKDLVLTKGCPCNLCERSMLPITADMSVYCHFAVNVHRVFDG